MKLLLLLFLIAPVSIFAGEPINLEVDVYPRKAHIFIDDKEVKDGGDLNRFKIKPGNYKLSAKLSDSTLIEKDIEIYPEDSSDKVVYIITGEKHNGSFRLSLGGQWVFNDYEKSPAVYYSEIIGGGVDTIEIYNGKPNSYGTIDIGFLTPNNLYFGVTSEILTLQTWLSFSKQWDLSPTISLMAGIKLPATPYVFGKTDQTITKNNYEIGYFYWSSYFNGELVEDDYLNYGWPKGYEGALNSDSGIVTNVLGDNGSTKTFAIDGQVNIGKKDVKLFIKGAAWLGILTDYDSYKVETVLSNYGYDEYILDTTYRITYDSKWAFMPSISLGFQYDMKTKFNDVGVHGPLRSKAEKYNLIDDRLHLNNGIRTTYTMFNGTTIAYYRKIDKNRRLEVGCEFNYRDDYKNSYIGGGIFCGYDVVNMRDIFVVNTGGFMGIWDIVDFDYFRKVSEITFLNGPKVVATFGGKRFGLVSETKYLLSTKTDNIKFIFDFGFYFRF
jgi:hypothetical protein